MRRTNTALLVALAGATLALTACGTPPTRADRMKSPQTAQHGPAFKRLVITFNEAHQLAVKSADYAARLETEGSDPDKVLAAQELADDAARFADECEWFLANRRRMQWHQSYMNDLWVRYDELDESHRGTVMAYSDKDTRKPSRYGQLVRSYNSQHDLDLPPSRWGDLTYTVGAKQYPGNPWSGDEKSGN